MIEIQYYAGTYEAYFNGSLLESATNLKDLFIRLANHHSDDIDYEIKNN